MTADDAANLLIAVMASEQVRDSAKTVHEFGSLITRGDKLLTDVSSKLARRHTFREGLSGVISLLASDGLKHGGNLSVDVKIEVRDPASSIVMSNDLGEPILSYAPMTPVKDLRSAGDLYITKRVTQLTIFTIAELLKSEARSDANPSLR
ncbi:hypothetical protein [Methylobacterium tardum]|uniref:hypothetical protein n=1 Tax=Methylobacterium tardum TaxID=374432 RepID=UPI001EE13C4C|nr:hypothetical protein [Methylobacterium tardum]URD35819.1 hypothetical protein M6G65_25735 [Methylobacterium tardum]